MKKIIVAIRVGMSNLILAKMLVLSLMNVVFVVETIHLVLTVTETPMVMLL